MFDHDFHFGFHFAKTTDSTPIYLTSIGCEREWYPNIIHDNSERNIWTYLFLYTIDGTGIVTVDGKEYRLKKHDAALLFMPGNSTYQGDPTSKTLWRYCFIMFIAGQPPTKMYCNEILEKVGPVFTLSPESHSIQSMYSLISRRRSGLINTAPLAYAAGFDFIANLYNDIQTNCIQYSLLIQNAIHIIQERYAKLDGVIDLAEHLHVSPEHLTRTFTKEIGMSPVKYLSKIRMEHAIDLLKESSYSIDEIATKVGFSNGNYFSKQFRKHMAMSPSDYRNLKN